jgi:hypothetical protein
VEPVPYAKLDNPQSLNLYTYVVDNPLRFTDADGHEEEGSSSSDSVSGTGESGQGAPGGSAQNQKPQYENPQNESEAKLGNVTYNEFGGARPDPKAKPSDPGSPEQLHAARVAVAEVANRVLESDHPERVQARDDLTSKAVHDINAGNRDIIAAHNDSLSAARTALDGSNTTNDAMHYRTSNHDLNSLYGNKATMHFGPFPNAQGGTVYLIVAP